MTSPLLALFTLSVRADTRAKSTYWARAGLAAFVLAIMVATALASGARGAPGLAFFKIIIFVQAIFITLAGLSYFASAITEEKEEEMLGLLRMTKLNGLSILLGKSTSRLSGAVLLLLGQLPFTLLAITLGGVSMPQVLATYCALGGYLFFLSNLALLSSVIASRTAQAALLTAAVLSVCGFAGTLLEIARGATAKLLEISPAATATLETVAEALNQRTPFFRLQKILTTGFHEAACDAPFWSNIGAGVACFLAAWLIFERRSEMAGTPLLVARRLRRKLALGTRPGAYRAVEWKDFHFLHGGRLVRVGKVVGYAVFVFVFFWSKDLPLRTWQWQELSALLAGLFAAALALEAGWASSRIFNAEIHGQTLPALTLLPLSLANLFGAKISGCLPAIAPVGYGFLLSTVWAVLCAVWMSGHDTLPTVAFALVALLYVIFFVIAHVILFAQVTAYLSLRIKRGAFLLAIAIWCALAAVAEASRLQVGFILLVLSPLLCVMLGAVFQKKVLDRLRVLAAEG